MLDLVMNGVEVRRRRELKGLERIEFAAQCGITPGYLSHLETGRRQPSPAVFGRICVALGIPEDQRGQLLVSEKATA